MPGRRERCLRIGSAGKPFSLTGWKIGYVSGDASLIPLVAKAHQNLTFTTAPNLQRGVAVGLAKEDAYFESLSSELQARRDRLSFFHCPSPIRPEPALEFCWRQAAVPPARRLFRQVLAPGARSWLDPPAV